MRQIARTTLSDRIISELLGLIEQGYVKPGDRLPPERELSKQLGVGRSSLREAMRLLTMLGLLETRHGDGTYVREWTWAFYSRPLRWGLRLAPESIDQVV
ncbi:MAG: GntR family transcriptional regulator, partial [Bacillota bacterium]